MVVEETSGEKPWWEATTARSLKGRKVYSVENGTFNMKSAPSAPVTAETSSSGGRCTCQCEAPKIVRIEVPKIQIKYIPVVVKNRDEDAQQVVSYKKQGAAAEEQAPEATPSKGPVEMEVQKQVVEESVEEVESPDSYPSQSRRQRKRSRYGISYIG